MSSDKRLINGEHVLRRSWSEKDDAIKIIPSANTEFSIELSAEDGDSVITIPNTLIITDTEAHSCIGMSTACLFGEGTVSISPMDSGDEWHNLTVASLVPVKICARRIKISGGKLVLQAV